VREEDAGAGGWERLERALVACVVAHSCGVGLFLALAPAAAAAFAGFGSVEPEFFARQAGIFHLVLAAGYLAEYLGSRGVVLLVMAKGAAVAFLGLAVATDGRLPWSVPFSAALDGLMCAAVALSHRRAGRSRARRAAAAWTGGPGRGGGGDQAVSGATGWPDSSS
jgi:hypothetical protein